MAERKKRLTVMVVDDDPDVTQSIVQALSDLEKEFGFQTVPSFDGLDAQQNFEVFLPEIVILDLLLPGRGGFQLLQKWKGVARNKGKLPIVIMITGNEGLLHKVYAERNGVDEYLRKPFSMTTLLELLREYLTKLPTLEWVENYKKSAEKMGLVEIPERSRKADPPFKIDIPEASRPHGRPTVPSPAGPALRKIKQLRIAVILIILIGAMLIALIILCGIYGLPW